MSIQNDKKTGVVLMTYGSATVAENVKAYFSHIYPNTSQELIEDFENRYRLVGGSPLVAITKEQAARLQEALGDGYVVRAGMRHSEPFIDEAIAECQAAGATALFGIILAPQFSQFIMDGYTKDFTESALRHGFSTDDIVIAKPWGTEPHFIELLVQRIAESLTTLRNNYGIPVPVVFTTHSLPQRVVEKDPDYLQQLEATITAVRAKLGQEIEWHAGYQSAGHTPEAWLKPDLVDILGDLQKKNAPAVLIVPIQFLADHLEILYDLDIAGREQCEEFGIAYHRIALANTDPLFIEALKTLVTTI